MNGIKVRMAYLTLLTTVAALVCFDEGFPVEKGHFCALLKARDGLKVIYNNYKIKNLLLLTFSTTFIDFEISICSVIVSFQEMEKDSNKIGHFSRSSSIHKTETKTSFSFLNCRQSDNIF